MVEDIDSYVRVVDQKHYLYCPRIVYFDRVMDVGEMKSSNSLREGERGPFLFGRAGESN